MGSGKSEKELAYLRDLYVAPDWGERFAQLIDDNVVLPKKGRVLYVGAGTGSHALSLLERAGNNVTLVCLDESDECLEIARAKASTLKFQPDFQRQQLEALDFEDEMFDLVVGETSMISVDRLPEIVAEMVRVTKTGGTVALNVATASSFGEFFSIYWEAIQNSGIENHEHDVESLITGVPTVSDVEGMLRESGLEDVSSWTRTEEFDFSSSQEFLDAPLVADFLMRDWMESLPSEDARRVVSNEIARIIDEERGDMDFALSVKATLATGRKR